MNKSIINSYRLQPPPTQRPTPTGVIPAVTSANTRRAVLMLAVVLLPLLAVGVVVYAAQATRPAPAAVQPVPSVSVATPIVVERVVEVQAAPVVVIVTATPAPARVEQAAPVQVAPRVPAVSQPAPLPTARPRLQPTTAPPLVSGGPVRAAGVSAPAQPAVGPQQRLLSRPCEYRRQTYPQGTVIRGYYTDATGQPRDSICRADGWKAVD